MAELGRHPTGNDIGVGNMEPGRARGSIMGRPSSNGWVYLFGGRVGKQPGSGNATYYQALYGTTNGTTISTLIGQSVAGIASTVMDWGGNGANQTLKPTAPFKIYNTYDYALVARVSAGNFAHGQDHSGHPMHDRTGAASSFPSPFSASYVRPEGKASFWVEYQPNRAPKKPSGLAPANGALITTTTPTLGADFRDDDEDLPGFDIGDADKLKKYRFVILNSAKTSTIRDTGILNASTAEQDARRAEYVPTALPADTYVARCTMWDQFDVPSETVEWTFTINAGGAFESPDIRADQYVSPGLTNGDGSSSSLTAAATWTHSNGLSAQSFEMALLSESGSVVRGPDVLTMTTAPDVLREWHFSAAGWSSLTRGQRYRLRVRGQDTGGLWSGYSYSPYFRVNAYPSTPSSPSPVNSAWSTRPQLSVAIADLNDASSTLTAEFAVRPSGDTTDGVVIAAGRTTYSDGRHRATPDASEMPGYGIYEWRARGIDPWGLAGAWTAWQTITYALPPVVTISVPAASAVLTTGTPTISGSADKSLTSLAITIRDTATDAIVYDSGTVSASGTSWSHTVPPGLLRNDRSYRATATLVSTDLLTGTGTVTFSISYPQPAALTGITVAPHAGPFEPLAAPSQWSRLLITFDPVLVADVSDEDFAGYYVRRTDLATGVEERIDGGKLLARDATAFLDRTPTSGAAYRYDAGYLKRVNLVDVVESAPASAEGSVTLENTVLCTLDTDDLGVPLRYWEDRKPKPVREWEFVPSFGSSPIPFQGRTDYRQISATFVALDDRYGTFRAQDIVDTVERMGAPVVNVDGSIRSRMVSYRDPRGRNLVVVINDVDPEDQHHRSRGVVAIEMTEASTQLAMEVS